jgi:two-component system OmpR family response regulator
MHVLVAEDDTRLADLLTQALTEAGWEVEAVGDGRSAYGRALPGGVPYDVLLLDRMLPGMDGLTVCRKLRALGVGTPVLMLTALGQTPDKISGLDAGADDYVTKPFELDELLARLRALHRRHHQSGTQVLEIDGLRLDPEAHTVTRDGTGIELSAREFSILHLLMERVGRVVTRFTILDEVWDGETDLKSNVIDVHVASLRGKIDRPFGTETITTVRGVGYRLDGRGS